MTDETDTVSEVARVLALAAGEDPIRLVNLGQNSAVWKICSAQADALAEAGLLREAADSAEPCTSEVWSMDYYRDGQVDPYWIRCNAIGPHTEHEDANTGLTWTTDDPEEAQIATQEPAGEPVARPEGVGTSGTLSGRLRALVTGADPKATHEAVDVGALGRLADEADVLEAAYRVADTEIARLSGFHDHYRAQVERVRAQLVRMTKSSDEKTQRHGTALLHILDGTDAP